MPEKHPRRVLFGVSSVGLGHTRRSLAIAKKIEDTEPGGFEIDWLCAEPALTFLEKSGERVLDVSREMKSVSSVMETKSLSGRIQDMSSVAKLSSDIAKQNYSLIKSHLKDYDILVQDEFIETLFSSVWDKDKILPPKRAVVTDYVKFETPSLNPVNRLVLWYANRLLKKAFFNSDVRIFADDLEAIPDRMRSWTRANFEIVGPIVSGMPEESKGELRKELFPDIQANKLIVFSVGGTSVGRPLVDFALENSEYLSEHLNALIVVLGGPRIDAASLLKREKQSAKVISFTPDAPRYFKASDCVVTQAGASTLNEIAAIGVPCVSIPIENHWEQRANATRFSKQYGFQTLEYRNLNKENVLRSINSAISSKYTPMQASKSVDRAARLIISLGHLV